MRQEGIARARRGQHRLVAPPSIQVVLGMDLEPTDPRSNCVLGPASGERVTLEELARERLSEAEPYALCRHSAPPFSARTPEGVRRRLARRADSPASLKP